MSKIFLSTLIALFISALNTSAQDFCPENDSCLGSIETFACQPVYFCNNTCEYEFYEQDMDATAGPWSLPCHYINYDQWFEFTYPVFSAGYLTIDIWGGDCTNPDGEIGNHGPLEGWTFLLWEGETCEDAELVFSTSCYWMTDSSPSPSIGPDDWAGIVDYDPTRQEWYITISNAIPNQHYFVQIDGFGWCRGCGWFQWCDEVMFLELEDNPVIETVSADEDKENLFDNVVRVTNAMGQESLLKYNEILVLYYKYKKPRVVIIQNQ
jgi:hypothetical protein